MPDADHPQHQLQQPPQQAGLQQPVPLPYNASELSAVLKALDAEKQTSILLNLGEADTLVG